MLLFVSGCTLIMKQKWKLKAPKIENQNTLKKSLGAYHISKETYIINKPVYSSNDSIYIRNAYIHLFFYNRIGKLMCFDRNGFFIDPLKDIHCLAQVDIFLDSLSTDRKYNIEKDVHLSKYLTKITTLNREKITVDSLNSVDFYILIPWSNWLGATKKDATKYLKKLQQKNNLKIEILLVNSDVYDDWEDKDRLIKKLNLSPTRKW